MGGTLLRRRGLRRRSPGLSGGDRLRQVGFRPADHVARLRAAASDGGSNTGALTLDDLIIDTWRALCEWETVQCPLCGGEMERGGKVDSRSAAVEETNCHGECVDCGTRLS
jgi:hypothetical protein